MHLGTGNYNEKTARVYTDFGLLTTSPLIAEDATALFSALTGYSDPPRLEKLVMAPTGLRQRFLKLIARERRRADVGQPAEIIAKMNSLIDGEIIEALYAASQAGVRIRLNVRGICALRPALPPVSANIEVVSVVDRFLEHSRIYYFLNGGDEDVYLSSADWMSRNLDKRIELMFPIENAEHKAKVLHALRAMFRDTRKSRWLGADGVDRRRQPAPDTRTAGFRRRFSRMRSAQPRWPARRWEWRFGRNNASCRDDRTRYRNRRVPAQPNRCAAVTRLGPGVHSLAKPGLLRRARSATSSARSWQPRHRVANGTAPSRVVGISW